LQGLGLQLLGQVRRAPPGSRFQQDPVIGLRLRVASRFLGDRLSGSGHHHFGVAALLRFTRRYMRRVGWINATDDRRYLVVDGRWGFRFRALADQRGLRRALLCVAASTAMLSGHGSRPLKRREEAPE